MTPEQFEPTMIDRREHAVAIFRGKLYTPSIRPWSKVTGVCLHQTACWMGEKPERYDHTQAHFIVTRTGKVIRLFDSNKVTIHGNGWNNQCVGIEIDGAYAGVEGDIRTFWDDPSTIVHEQPMEVTEVAMEAARNLVRWIVADVASHGGEVDALVAHRQASESRRDDPGSAIWKGVALPLHAELGLHDGGVGFKLGDGYAIPESWDPRCTGIKY